MRTDAVVRVGIDVGDRVLYFLHPPAPFKGVLDGREIPEDGEDTTLLFGKECKDKYNQLIWISRQAKGA